MSPIFGRAAHRPARARRAGVRTLSLAGLAALTLAVGFAGGAGVGVAFNSYGSASALAMLDFGEAVARPLPLAGVQSGAAAAEPLYQGEPRGLGLKAPIGMVRAPAPIVAGFGSSSADLLPKAPESPTMPSPAAVTRSAQRLATDFVPEEAPRSSMDRGSMQLQEVAEASPAQPPSVPPPAVPKEVVASTGARTGAAPVVVAAAVNPAAVPRPALLGEGARIAIVLDDLGMNVRATRRTIDLDPKVTLAFLPYAEQVVSLVSKARARKHEVLLHMPMEPLSAQTQLGTNPLLTGLNEKENLKRLRWALDRLPAEIGVNNHMGSRYTGNRPAMDMVMAEMASRNLIFLDSRTTGDSVAADAARSANVPFASRDVFLDNEKNADYILGQLRETERVARRRGHAVAIGHGVHVTIDVLMDWIPDVKARGFELVPISRIAFLHTTKSVAARSPQSRKTSRPN